MPRCSHFNFRMVKRVSPGAPGCEECLKTGSWWVHLRLCRECGHVGCCDQSPNRHVTAHFRATKHPVMECYDPPKGWGRRHIDEMIVDRPNQTSPSGSAL